MELFSQLIDLITKDPITLTASAVLAIAVIGLLVVINWPARDARPQASSARSTTARGLAASGIPATDIARRTGLSRDGLTLLLNTPPRGARQMTPHAAGTSLFKAWKGREGRMADQTQVMA